ncbi:hypothetical protein KKA53_01695 [Candidatus Dependentiae bacterium]|nr:hypothetical protein [Candidatus Dependentiae bacterium]
MCLYKNCIAIGTAIFLLSSVQTCFPRTDNTNEIPIIEMTEIDKYESFRRVFMDNMEQALEEKSKKTTKKALIGGEVGFAITFLAGILLTSGKTFKSLVGFGALAALSGLVGSGLFLSLLRDDSSSKDQKIAGAFLEYLANFDTYRNETPASLLPIMEKIHFNYKETVYQHAMSEDQSKLKRELNELFQKGLKEIKAAMVEHYEKLLHDFESMRVHIGSIRGFIMQSSTTQK